MEDELSKILKLAGVNRFSGFTQYTIEDMSANATSIKKKEKKLGIKPGDNEWFKLWFSLPMTNIGFRGRK